jgi:DNA-binding response OmpR family regulator
VHDSIERRGTTGIGGEKMRPGTRVLLVEDDRLIAEFVEPELERLGFRVRCAYDGPSGLEAARNFEPELLVLDIMLPKLDGVGVLKELRSEGVRTPVIMLTARDATIDKVHSLDLGADDYVTKPFEMDELLARIRALLRRTEGDEVLRVADLEVNTSTHEVRRKERKIDLTAREYALLEFMANHPNRVLSRELLLSQVWDRGFGVTTNVVEVYIAYLRKKVDGPGEQRLIQTLRGSGYALKGA